jgi:para-aminobenzoate synthetase component 1
LALTPQQALARWPHESPLAALWSGGGTRSGGIEGRWTVLAAPSDQLCQQDSLLPDVPLHSTARSAADAPPFQGGWIGCLEYELGAVLEPAAVRHGPQTGRGTLVHWLRCDDALIFDHLHHRWWAIGQPPELLGSPQSSTFTVGSVRHTTPRAEYQRGVERALEYIRAGDVYQVNLAHHLEAPFQGDPRAFFAALAAAADPWYGAYLELSDKTICSASPELFLDFDPATRTLTTRPMKGTRTLAGDAELRTSDKERAELTMITDLMRNDLGHVCELGSIRVTRPRDIERHGQLLQATATIQGTLRKGLTLSDALAAVFPGGSITGAPKIRAMQIIEELEPTPRGPYCGCIGYISRSGHAALNIAIRTATITQTSAGATLDYPVGAGVVADSNPAAEWQETLDKADVLMRAIGGAGVRP